MHRNSEAKVHEKMEYVLGNLRDLLAFSRGSQMPMLTYFIEMAYLEADSVFVDARDSAHKQRSQP